ncbi:MAG: hypothetical protein LBJ03_03865 [Holosporales bacterium]|jgi:methionyl-tRNA formyltransferase|nr:hypothetical protein [Holosporales bacterium]
MRNIIFVAKTTGLECLEFHLRTFENNENFIVVMEPNKDEIKGYLNERSMQFIDIDNFSIDLLRGHCFDWLLNLWGGHIFKQDMLNMVKNSLNIHPSYLPYGRGRDPVVWAIRNHHPAGVTLHKINEKVDEGGNLVPRTKII